MYAHILDAFLYWAAAASVIALVFIVAGDIRARRRTRREDLAGDGPVDTSREDAAAASAASIRNMVDPMTGRVSRDD